MRKVLGFFVGAALMAGCIVSTPAGTTTMGATSSGSMYSGYSQVNLAVTNATGGTICYLYISPVSDPNWGPDQLGSRVLSPGETDTYSLYAGQWDIRADDCGHNQVAVLRNTTIAANSNLVIR